MESSWWIDGSRETGSLQDGNTGATAHICFTSCICSKQYLGGTPCACKVLQQRPGSVPAAAGGQNRGYAQFATHSQVRQHAMHTLGTVSSAGVLSPGNRRAVQGPHNMRVAFAPSSSFHSSGTNSAHTELLRFPALTDAQQQLLCDTLQLPQSAAQLILLSCPEASTMPAAQVAANWQQLQQLLPLPRHMLLQAMLQLPSLLPQPQQTVAARLADAARVFQVPVNRLKGRRREATTQLHWRLLVTPQQQLEQQLRLLVQLLGGLQQQQVVQLVCREPRLLAVEAAQLLSTVEALEQICGCQLARLFDALRVEPRLLVTTADSLYRAAAALQQLLRLSEEGLTLVVRRAPAALIVPPTRITDLLTELPAAMSVGAEVAADILLQEPELLVRSPGAILAVLSVLRSSYRLSSEALVQVVQFDPSVLLLSPGQLAEETKQFRRLAGSHPTWAAEYKHLMSRPVNVARALRIEPLRLQRLVFLSRQGFAGTISLRNALTLSGRKFMALYPRYRAWLADVYSKGNPPKRYAGSVMESLDEGSEDDSDY